MIVNLLLFFTAFRLLTSDEVEHARPAPGRDRRRPCCGRSSSTSAATTSTTCVRHAKETSGLFAFVLGLLAWLYLGAQVTLFAAEVNVVRARRLWPRSFFSDPLLDADRRALTSSAEVEERVDEQNVEVSFDAPEYRAGPSAGRRPATSRRSGRPAGRLPDRL